MHLSPLLRSRGVLAALATTVALTATACGGDDSAPQGAANGGGSAPESITIAYQAIPNGDLVVKQKGWLEAAFPDTTIEWKRFDSGGAVNEAIAAKSVDIGLAGSSHVSRGLSQPLPYQVPWIHDVIGAAEALAVKPGIDDIAGLKGKKIATPLASTAHYSLLAAVEGAGLKPSDVDIIDAEPDDIYAAWERGDIDGAYVWNPTLAKLKEDGGKTLISSAELAEQGKTTYDLAVVTNEFAEQYPEALQTWVAQQHRAVELYRSDEDAWAAAVATELDLEPADVKAQAADLIFLNASEQLGADYLGGGLATNLFAAAQFNKELDQIPTVQPESAYADAVNPAPAKAVSGT